MEPITPPVMNCGRRRRRVRTSLALALLCMSGSAHSRRPALFLGPRIPARTTRLAATTSRAPATAGGLDSLIPDMSSPQLLQFERDGHTVVRGLLTKDEMQQWSAPLLKAFHDEELEAYRHEVRVFFGDEEYEKAKTMEQCLALLSKKSEDDNTPFLQVFNLWRRHDNLRPFCLAKRFGHIAAQLLGVEKVRLYQDSMFIKRPEDGPTLYHTDLGTAPFDTNKMLTFWLPLTHVPSVDEGGSPLCFATGSHRDLSFAYWWNPHNDDDDLIEDRYVLHDYAPLSPGDATVHHGWCLHGSPSNELDESRVAFSLVFIADGARLIPDTAEYEPDAEDSCSYDDWIEDVEPGDVADHPLLPIVYP